MRKPVFYSHSDVCDFVFIRFAISKETDYLNSLPAMITLSMEMSSFRISRSAS